MAKDTLKIGEVRLDKGEVGYEFLPPGHYLSPKTLSDVIGEEYYEPNDGTVALYVGTGDPEDDPAHPDIMVSFHDWPDTGSTLERITITGMASINEDVRNVAHSAIDALADGDGKAEFLRWCSEHYRPVEFEEL